MTFEEAARAAAKAANAAVTRTMNDFAGHHVYDEDDISPYLLGALRTTFDDAQIGGLTWRATILRHRRGVANEEGKMGADMLIHIAMDTPTQKYSKGVLVQAKKVGPQMELTNDGKIKLNGQCRKMLDRTPAAFVFDYAVEGMRCDAALKVIGETGRDLYQQCSWTSYRFFWELFRCPVGDERITSAAVEDLPVSGGISLKARGQLTR